MMSVLEYSSDVSLSVDVILKLCTKLGIDAKSEEDARKYYDLCCQKYLLANSMDKAAECLVKVAKVVEKSNINMTAGYMLRACNLLVVCY